MSEKWLIMKVQGERDMQYWSPVLSQHIVDGGPAGHSSESVDKTELTSFD